MAMAAQTTQILLDLAGGDRSAADRLMPLVYHELRALAQRQLQLERPDHTLQATALVNEAYLRLIDQRRVDWKSRAHFFSVAAAMIRRILVDHARSRQTAKRGGPDHKVKLTEAMGASDDTAIDMLALDEALEKLGRLNDRHRKVVELRFFGGLSVDETAHVLCVSPRSVGSDWQMARAWLRQRLQD